jgi:capsular exopolysaccharide synthesis family protein
MDLRTYLHMVRRRWLLILSCFVLSVVAAMFVTARATPQYASTARLFISTPGSDTTGVDAYQGSLFSAQRVASYADLVTGKALAQRVVDSLHLSESPSGLSGQVTSKVVTGTVLLDVTVTDPDAVRAQRLANAVASQFTFYIVGLETTAGKTASPIKATVVDSAGLPGTPVSPEPVRNIALAAVLGLMVGLGVAFLRESLDNTVKSGLDIVAATGGALLGHIPFDSLAAKRPLITELEAHAPRVEATRMLRTNLQFVHVDRDSKVFVVTSSVPGEGKTTTAINLAIATAKAGQSVLLLEGDLRRPKIADYLHLEGTVGLTTALIGKVGVEEAIQEWGEDGLEVITSGAKPPNPAELVQSEAMKHVLDKLRSRYDMIIVDAPPLLPVTDGALLSAQADGAILVVRHSKTTKDQVAQAAKHLTDVDATLLGTVLNMTHQRRGTGYAYGYSYGYGYSSEDSIKRRRGARKSRKHGRPPEQMAWGSVVEPAADPAPQHVRAAEPTRR